MEKIYYVPCTIETEVIMHVRAETPEQAKKIAQKLLDEGAGDYETGGGNQTADEPQEESDVATFAAVAHKNTEEYDEILLAEKE